jgi:hypothetical protein
MSWQEHAACADDRNEDWLGDVVTLDLAVTCHGCPVRLECLTEALPRDIRWDAGIWGGTTPKQRGDIRNRKASVADAWRTLDQMVKEAHRGQHDDMDYQSGLLSGTRA